MHQFNFIWKHTCIRMPMSVLYIFGKIRDCADKHWMGVLVRNVIHVSWLFTFKPICNGKDTYNKPGHQKHTSKWMVINWHWTTLFQRFRITFNPLFCQHLKSLFSIQTEIKYFWKIKQNIWMWIDLNSKRSSNKILSPNEWST